MSGRIYLDSSAAVKLVVAESESVALRAFVAGATSRISSRILGVELLRAVSRSKPTLLEQTRAVLEVIEFVELDQVITERAAELRPPALRSLDAIHLASALELGPDLGAFVTYDARQIEAAHAIGLGVESPA